MRSIRRITFPIFSLRAVRNYSLFWFACFTCLVIWQLYFLLRTVISTENTYVFTLFDDAMISMRYARHLASGHGLVWNIGEFVEGYTNPLWTLTMAAAILIFGVEIAPLSMQIFGLLLSLSSIGLLCKATYEYLAFHDISVLDSHLYTFVVFILCSTLYPLHYWSLVGMEVAPIALLTSLAALLFVRTEVGWLSAETALCRLIVILLLSYFCRPDSILTFLPILIYQALAVARHGREKHMTTLVITFIIAASAVIGHFIFRIYYYKHMVPNTYTLKMEGYGLAERLWNGVNFLITGGFFVNYGPLIFFLTVLIVMASRQNKTALILSAPLPIAVSYQIYVGGDPWPYWRQITPALLFYYMAGGIAFFFAARRHDTICLGRRFLVLASVTAIILSSIWSNRAFTHEILFSTPFQYDSMKKNIQISRALNSVLEPQATIVSFWAGAIPYFWNGRAIDPLGKTDDFIASSPINRGVSWGGMKGVPGHAKHNLQHSIIDSGADYTQSTSWFSDRIPQGILLRVEHKGVKMWLRRDSRFVRWDQVEVIEDYGTSPP